MSNSVLVIGAVNVDIFASTQEEYLLEDSNIANINLGFGGVGGNIATNLRILNQDVSFLTAFSDDILGKFLRSHYKELAIDTAASHVSKTSNASVYLGIMDEKKDLFLGLNDMGIIEELDRKYLEAKHDYINQFEYIVIDNNLSMDTLHYLLTTYQNKYIIMDAVSAKKVSKITNMLSYISTLKLNQLELDTLSDETETINQLNDVLHKGVKEVLVTNKDQPVYYASKQLTKKFNVKKCTNIVNATGAGDAFISGYIKGLINNEDIDERIECAMMLATATLKVATSTLEKGELL